MQTVSSESAANDPFLNLRDHFDRMDRMKSRMPPARSDSKTHEPLFSSLFILSKNLNCRWNSTFRMFDELSLPSVEGVSVRYVEI